MKKFVLVLVPILLSSCTTPSSPQDVSVEDPTNDRAAVSFPAPPKIPDVQQ